MLVVGFAAGFSLAAVAALVVTRADKPADTLSNLMRKDGFDFTELRAPSKPWRGPELGEKIDLSRLKGADGRTLADVAADGPAMLVAVKPSCRMCRTAADTMQEIGARLSVLGIPYHIVAFVPVEENFHAYVGSLGAGQSSFVWSQDGEAPPAAIVLSLPWKRKAVALDGGLSRGLICAVYDFAVLTDVSIAMWRELDRSADK